MTFPSGTYYRDGAYNTPRLSISARERTHPGTIRAVTGWMDICTQCGNRFRRLGERVICGACYPAPPLVETRTGGYRNGS